MGDIFLCKEAQQVLANKHIAVIGGSNMRGLYKDMIWLLNDNSIIPYEVLGEKLEKVDTYGILRHNKLAFIS